MLPMLPILTSVTERSRGLAGARLGMLYSTDGSMYAALV